MPSILIVSHCFPPDYSVGAKRALRMATHLARFGWKVQVLTVKDSYFEDLDSSLMGSEPPFETIRTHAFVPKHWLKQLRSKERRESRGGHPPATGVNGNRPLGRLLRGLATAWDAIFSLPDSKAGWLPLAIAAGLSRARGADLVLATYPPNTSALAATLIARRLRVPLVLDCRDPWMPVPGEVQPPRWRLPLDRALERFCLKRAALVVATTQGLQRELAAAGVGRSVVVPNAFNATLMDGIQATRYRRFTLVYAGSLSGLRSAAPVLAAIRSLRDAGALPPGGMGLRILGSTGHAVKALAEREGLPDVVEVEDFLPYREALARMKGADLLLLVVADSHARLIPAKLFDYLAARRFILAVAPEGSDAGALVAELNAGKAVDPRDVEGLTRVLRERLSHPGDSLTLPEGAARYEERATMENLDGYLRQVLRHP